MRIRDYIILGLIMIWLVLVIIRQIKQKNYGSCSACSHRDSCIYKADRKSCSREKMNAKHGEKFCSAEKMTTKHDEE